MGMDPPRNDQDSLGLFQAPPSINVGAPFVTDKGPKSDRIKGRQFVTSVPKRGKTADVTFSPFLTLSVGTPYIELGRLQQRARNENAKKQLVPQPFRPSHPSAKACGSGSYYGAMSKHENMKSTDDYDKRPAKKGEQTAGMRNVITSPPRKGTYGFVGLNMGGKPEGVLGEFKYLGEPAKGRPSTSDPVSKPKSFIPPSPASKGTYGYIKLNINGKEKPYGFANEYQYTVAGVAGGITARREKVALSEMKPFVPSHPPKKGGGYYGTMRWSGQEYKEDPEKVKWEKMMAEKKAEREKYGGLVFRPNQSSKSMRTSSIANHPRNQEGGHPAAVNARLFLQRRAATGQT